MEVEVAKGKQGLSGIADSMSCSACGWFSLVGDYYANADVYIVWMRQVLRKSLPQLMATAVPPSQWMPGHRCREGWRRGFSFFTRLARFFPISMLLYPVP